MLSLLGFLLPLAGQLAAAYKAKQNATTDQERIEAEERIAQIQAQQRLQSSEAGSKINALMRAMLAAPVAIFFWKVIVFDKVLGWGSTDDLSPSLWSVAMIVTGFYFLHSIVRGR